MANLISKETTLPRPVGMVLPFVGSNAPHYTMICEGQALSTALFPELSALLDGNYGPAPEAGMFYLPDARGNVVLGAVDETEVGNEADSGTAVADFTISSADSGDHSHAVTFTANGLHNHSIQAGTNTNDGAGVRVGGDTVAQSTHTSSSAGAHTHTLTVPMDGGHTHTVTLAGGDPETRPINMAVDFLIVADANAVYDGFTGPDGPVGARLPTGEGWTGFRDAVWEQAGGRAVFSAEGTGSWLSGCYYTKSSRVVHWGAQFSATIGADAAFVSDKPLGFTFRHNGDNALVCGYRGSDGVIALMHTDPDDNTQGVELATGALELTDNITTGIELVVESVGRRVTAKVNGRMVLEVFTDQFQKPSADAMGAQIPTATGNPWIDDFTIVAAN